MALTRKFLSALGIETDKIDEIINAHTDTVNALKEARTAAEEQANKNADAASRVEELEKELSETKSQLDASSLYKDKYENLKSEYDNYKNGVETEKVKQSKLTAYKNLLKESKISDKYADKIIKLTDFDSIELDNDGKLKKIDELKKSIQEDWKEFVGVDFTKGAEVDTPPKDDGSKDNPNTKFAADRVAQYMADRYGVAAAKK